jgi:hypothetical protein
MMSFLCLFTIEPLLLRSSFLLPTDALLCLLLISDPLLVIHSGLFNLLVCGLASLDLSNYGAYEGIFGRSDLKGR